MIFNPVLNLTGQLIGDNLGGTSYSYLGRYFNTLASTPVIFNANGNTIGGGIMAPWQDFQFTGNSNTFNGGITVAGYNSEDWRSVHLLSAGVVTIGGGGNTFGAAAINLNRYGTLDLTTGQNLSNVTAINFNGGTLRLRAAGSTLPSWLTAWNIPMGQLIIANDTVLGDPSIGLNLGSTSSFATVTGCWGDDAGISRAVTLNGQGAFFNVDALDFIYGTNMNISSTISGSGMLIKVGNGNMTLKNTVPNTYTGGTVVAEENLTLEAGTSLGTGDVKVVDGGRLVLTGAGNVAPGAKVLVQKTQDNFQFGLLNVSNRLSAKLDLQADVMPTIDPNSDGVISIETAALPGGPIATALGAAAPGNGRMFLSSGYGYGHYYGASLAAGADNTYRFGYGYSALNVWSSCLTGDNNVLTMGSGLNSWAAQTFTGKITVQAVIGIDNWNNIDGMGGFGVSDGNCFGDPSGNVELDAGFLYYNTNGASLPAVKNDLSYNGIGQVGLYTAPGGAGNTAQFNVSTLTRLGKSFLVVGPTSISDQTFGGVSGKTKFVVTGGVPLAANGMVDPYIVTANDYNNGDFLTHDTTNGFTAVSYAAMPTSGGAGLEIAQTAARP